MGRDLIIDAASPYALDLFDPDRSHAQRLAASLDRMGRLLRAAERTNAVLVHIGSSLTRDARQGAPLRRKIIEHAHPYFRMKAELERMAVTAARRGQPVVVVRPSSLLGPGNLRPIHHCYVSAVLSGGMPASFPDMINVLDVRDAAECTLRMVEAGWYGQPIQIAGHNITVHDLTDMIVELGGVRRPPRWRGLYAGAAVLFAAEAALGATGLRSRYPSLPVLLTLASKSADLAPLQRALGPELRPLQQTVLDEISWHRDRGCP